ncbi:MAG: TAXI family TRAP transporter solute-binding subunit [Candidatus Rariloculaceae bacterium]
MFFEPLWVFYSDPILQQGNLQLVRGERFSIGPVGSRTNSATRELFELVGLEAEDFDILTLSPNEAAEQLKAGTIAGAAIVASSPVIQDLLASPEIGLASFVRADALAALYPPLTKLTVHAGVGDLAANVPPDDVQILAFTTMLTARSDLHPAIQSLLLDAATQIHSVPDMFHADGSFPSSRTCTLQLSPTASRYYKSGRPFLQRYLPFWLAVLAVQLFAMALPLIGILYPAISVMPSVFDWAMLRRIYRLCGELRYLEMELAKDVPDADRSKHIEKLNDLDRRV